MAISVYSAFNDFLKDHVNLDPQVVDSARVSRDNLLENISEFSNNNFFKLYPEKNIFFGSFARKTKCRELDDIDIMICLHGENSKYSEVRWNDISISCGDSDFLKECADNGYINSTKILNRFKKRLEQVREYKRSEIHRNGEAVQLNLISKEWSFDIVPCFYTVPSYDGRSYYLIPDGKGAWKKTNPSFDRDNTTFVNQLLEGNLLELIRLCKKWNKVNNIQIPSYLLETMIITDWQYLNMTLKIYELFYRVLLYLKDSIYNPIYDLKKIQGDINNLSYKDQFQISNRISFFIPIVEYALFCEKIKNFKEALEEWRKVFGEEFPIYG